MNDKSIFTELVNEINKKSLLHVTGLVNNMTFLKDTITNYDLLLSVNKIIRNGKILKLNSKIIDEYNRIIASYVYNYPIYKTGEFIIFTYKYNFIIIDLKEKTRSIIKIDDGLLRNIINSENVVKNYEEEKIIEELKDVTKIIVKKGSGSKKKKKKKKKKKSKKK